MAKLLENNTHFFHATHILDTDGKWRWLMCTPDNDMFRYVLRDSVADATEFYTRHEASQAAADYGVEPENVRIERIRVITRYAQI